MEWSSHLAESYGKEHEQFLKEANPLLHKKLSQSGQLQAQVHSVGESAAETIQHVTAQNLRETNSLPPPEREKELRSRHLSMEEIVRHDLIHQPLPE
jgi:hypothetical protein